MGLDISNAFDRVWHAAFINEIEYFSFLTNRVMKFALNAFASKSIQSNAVRPGTPFYTFGPTVFLTFINDITNVISSQLYIYTDVTSIYSLVKSLTT